jgi:MFS family permease
VTAPPTGGPVRLVTVPFLALAVATLAFFVAAGIGLPVAPLFVEQQLHADRIGVGVAIASFSIAALILRPVVGWASDRFGRRPLLIGGSLLSVVALALHLVATDLPMFIAARALLGAAEGFYFVAALAAGSDLAPETRRGEAISFLSLSLYLGIAIGPPIGEQLLKAGGYSAVWIAAGGVAIVAAGLAWMVPETAPNVVRRGPRTRTPLIHPAGIFPGVVILFGLWGMAGLLTFLPAYARHVGLSDSGLPLAMYALVVVGLRVVGARWPDRFGAARLSGIALAVSAVGLAILGLWPSPVGLYAGVLVFASGVAFTMPALLTLAVSRVPEGERGTVVGTATLFLDIVFGTAPVALGFIADDLGYGAAFLASAGFAALASVLLVLRRSSLQPGRQPAALPSGHAD